MAHCVHMTDDEISLLKKYSTGVAHCPGWLRNKVDTLNNMDGK